MTIAELFEYVDEILENPFSDKIKLRWLNQVEAELQVDVLLLAAEGITQYTLNDLDAELLAPAPYDQLYHEYLFLQICMAQHEDDLANKYAVTYNRAYNEYVRFICETIDPGSGDAERLRYYLTAYQIAVKHGYSGSETEWLLSLRGPVGEGLNIVGMVAAEDQLPDTEELKPGTGYFVGTGADALLYIWNGSEWFFKQSLRGEPGEDGGPGPEGRGVRNITGNDDGTWTVLYSDGTSEILTNDGLRQIVARAEAAAGAAAAAQSGAQLAESNAKQAAQTAANYSYSASSSAGTAVMSANNAAGSARTAEAAAARAEEAAKGGVKSVNGQTPDENGNVTVETGGADVTAESIQTALGYTPAKPSDIPANTVRYAAQSLTEDQQRQARENIAAAAAADLANYYKKSETYSAEEINAKLSAIPKFAIKPVASLPTGGISATTVYLVATTDTKNLYLEYIFVPTNEGAAGPFTDSQGRWEPLGAQTVDLTGYAKLTDIPTTLPNPNALIINGQSYDGSKPVEVEVEGGGSGAAPDWNAAEGEPGHIANRTHWVEYVEETLYENTVTVSGMQFQDYSTAIPIVEGETYVVKWDGTDYTCVCFAFSYNGRAALGLGNMAILGGTNTGEPFAIGTIPELNATAGGAATNGTHSVSIVGLVKHYVPLQPEFVPPSLPYYIELEDPVGDYNPNGFTTTATQEEVHAALANGYQIVARFKVPARRYYWDYAFQGSHNNGSLDFAYCYNYDTYGGFEPKIDMLHFEPNDAGGYDIRANTVAVADAYGIPKKLPNPNALTINGTAYDGSEPVDINIPTGGGGDSVPDYVRTEAERVAAVVQSRQNANTFTFIAASDAHFSTASAATVDELTASITHMGQAMAIIREQVHVDLTVSLGDMVWDALDTPELGMSAMRYVSQCLFGGHMGAVHLRARGNHDSLYGSNKSKGTGQLNDNQIFANIGAWNKGSVFDSENKLGGYCYRDFEDAKLRVIILNTSETNTGGCLYSTQQIAWLTNALDLTEKGAGWRSIVMGHHPLDWARDGGGNPVTAVNGAPGLLCSFHGHTHNYLSGTVSGTGLPRLAIPNACKGRENEYGSGSGWGEATTYSKVPGTKNDTAFCVVTIDLAAHKIYADHYGAGYDREIEYVDSGENEQEKIRNEVEFAQAADSEAPYNGVGYKKGFYPASGGGDTEQSVGESLIATGYIPYTNLWKAGNELYIKGGDLTAINHVRICGYTSKGASVNSSASCNGTNLEDPYFTKEVLGEHYYKLTHKQNAAVNWIRLSLDLPEGYTGEELFVSIGKPID